MRLRSGWWDGPAPAPGDVVLVAEQAYVVRAVAEGAGLGHYALDVEARPTYRWGH